jgi:MSHA biogenesis protein MshM
MNNKQKINSEFFRKVKKLLNKNIPEIAKVLKVGKTTVKRLLKDDYDSKSTAFFQNMVLNLRLCGITNAEQLLIPGSTEDPHLVVIKQLKLKEVPPMNKNILEHYGLKKDPFKSPEVLADEIFITGESREIIDTVLEAAHSSRFLAVVGSVGSGKSTLFNYLRPLLMKESKMKCVFIPPIVTKHLNDKALLSKMLREIEQEKPINDIDERASQLAETIYELDQKGYRIIVLIDDAHQLPIEGWRGLKIIAESCPSISVIFFAQPRIHEVISRTELIEVQRRLEIIQIYSFSLKQVDLHDLEAYIQHKLKMAGGDDVSIFPGAVIKKIGALASNPLEVNNICKNLMVKAERIKEPISLEIFNSLSIGEF